ncbi:hypothetical protein H4219_004438 [Mycoemilia scoparia]|uniref:Homeobox domain-containing protein n=1 Tax=Mycoemilia scoparia TaxID=417184 RepID=A0A9W7ZSK7_9FUNG|nr:hypothetical protein H4219_004438 [Mycoemilia scoparia]
MEATQSYPQPFVGSHPRPPSHNKILLQPLAPKQPGTQSATISYHDRRNQDPIYSSSASSPPEPVPSSPLSQADNHHHQQQQYPSSPVSPDSQSRRQSSPQNYTHYRQGPPYGHYSENYNQQQKLATTDRAASHPYYVSSMSQHHHHNNNISGAGLGGNVTMGSSEHQHPRRPTTNYPNIVIRPPNTSVPKKAKRKRITPEQLEKLLAVFKETDTPTHDIREGLSKELNMTNREIQVWFQNRRAKVNRERQEEQRKLKQSHPAALMYGHHHPNPDVRLRSHSDSVVTHHGHEVGISYPQHHHQNPQVVVGSVMHSRHQTQGSGAPAMSTHQLPQPQHPYQQSANITSSAASADIRRPDSQFSQPGLNAPVYSHPQHGAQSQPTAIHGYYSTAAAASSSYSRPIANNSLGESYSPELTSSSYRYTRMEEITSPITPSQPARPSTSTGYYEDGRIRSRPRTPPRKHHPYSPSPPIENTPLAVSASTPLARRSQHYVYQSGHPTDKPSSSSLSSLYDNQSRYQQPRQSSRPVPYRHSETAVDIIRHEHNRSGHHLPPYSPASSNGGGAGNDRHNQHLGQETRPRRNTTDSVVPTSHNMTTGLSPVSSSSAYPEQSIGMGPTSSNPLSSYVLAKARRPSLESIDENQHGQPPASSSVVLPPLASPTGSSSSRLTNQQQYSRPFPMISESTTATSSIYAPNSINNTLTTLPARLPSINGLSISTSSSSSRSRSNTTPLPPAKSLIQSVDAAISNSKKYSEDFNRHGVTKIYQCQQKQPQKTAGIEALVEAAATVSSSTLPETRRQNSSIRDENNHLRPW